MPNFVSFATSIAEVAYGEKSCTQSLTQLILCSENRSFRFGIHLFMTYNIDAIIHWRFNENYPTYLINTIKLTLVQKNTQKITAIGGISCRNTKP